MTGGTWTNAGNVLIGMDASSAGNGTATGTAPAFGAAQGELDIRGGTFTVAAGKQMYVGASSATGVLAVSGSGNLTLTSGGILVGTTFDYLANTAGAGVNGTAEATPGTGSFTISGSGVVGATSLTVGASSNYTQTGGSLTVTTVTANTGSTITAAAARLASARWLPTRVRAPISTAPPVTFTGASPSITLNGGSVSLAANNLTAVAINSQSPGPLTFREYQPVERNSSRRPELRW